MSNYIEEGTDALFENQVLQSALPVIVDFWAPWCGPCRGLAPIFSELAEEYVNKLKFVKLDIDQNPTMSGQLKIQSIPTLILFKNGVEKDRLVGSVNKEKLKSFIDQAMQ